MERFVPRATEAQIDDLRSRIASSVLLTSDSLIPTVDDPTKSYGTNSQELKDLATYWLNEYDWRNTEREINEFSHFKATFLASDGIDCFMDRRLHFIHHVSSKAKKKKKKIPLLLVHGWPGSFLEFLKVIPFIEEDFEIVVPSLPGFGYSDGAILPGMSPKRMAQVLNALMTTKLGYDHYVVQGGDWGSQIARHLAEDFPKSVVAMHVNMTAIAPSKDFTDPRTYLMLLTMARDLSWLGRFTLSARDNHALDRLKSYLGVGSGYFVQQGTKPHTLGLALQESPVGVLSWIIEKMWEWSHHSDEDLFVDNGITKDEMLGNVTLYWLTQSITSSVRVYKEHLLVAPFQKPKFVRCPCGVAIWPKEILAAPKNWVELSLNVKRFTYYDRGGHFAAWERPEEMRTEILDFFTRDLNFEECVARAKNDSGVDGIGTKLSLASPVAVPAIGIAALTYYYLRSKA